MLFALAFIFNFSIGGLTGMFLGSLSTDIHLHDTDFIVAHFHYTMFGGAAFGLIGGVFHYFPKMFGRMYSTRWATTGWGFMFIGFNALYFPMLFLGYYGMPRRYHTYPDIPIFNTLQMASTIGSWVVVTGVIIVLSVWIHALLKGKRNTEANPWNSSTLEWQTETPPSLFNFEEDPVITRDPYDYEAFRKEVKAGTSIGASHD